MSKLIKDAFDNLGPKREKVIKDLTDKIEGKLSTYYKILMILSVICALSASFILIKHSYPGVGAILYATSFIFWYAGVMAPDNEKYK